MGYKKNWDLADIYNQIRSLSGTVNSRYSDGFTAFCAKQDLYQIKWFVDEQLKRSPKFSGEDEWLREEEKKKVVEILKDEM
jgi:hypothetical protein